MDDELERIKMNKLKKLMSKLSKEGEETKSEAPSVIELDFTNFDDFISKNRNVVVDFWAEWCGPCKMLSPVIKELASEFSGKVAFAKVNVDQNDLLAAKFSVSAIPTLIFFKMGRAVDVLVGALPKHRIKAWIEKNLTGPVG
ncbi:MAG: thioredoxin [Archaeoglobus sp.]|nr:MAG: thioredoxin [Archaeoglobus sp.]